MNGRDPRRKRMKKKKKKTPSPATIESRPSLTSLPRDLLLNCLARVSRLHYPTLSLVSKHFRSIVASTELYETRSLLRRTESCLYLCLRIPLDPNTYWFTLCQRPNRSLTKESTGNFLIPISSPPSPPLDSSSLVSFGSDIYRIGGKWPSSSSSRVSVLDCRFNTWRKAPRMRVKRRNTTTASLVDGKIYVAGGCKDINSWNWVEVFDPKTQTWENVTNPRSETRHESELISVGIGGKLSDCWYDCNARTWKKLNGVEGLFDFHHCKMVDLGGSMAVLWDGYVSNNNGYREEKVIWCAEIVLEMRDGDEMWGKIKWFDAVLTIHHPCRLFDADAISATV
ncbi:unnamed protein product [Cochlearia groenlandica]